MLGALERVAVQYPRRNATRHDQRKETRRVNSSGETDLNVLRGVRCGVAVPLEFLVFVWGGGG